MAMMKSTRLFIKDGKVYKTGTPVETDCPEHFLKKGAVLIEEPAPEESTLPVKQAKPKRAPRKKREA